MYNGQFNQDRWVDNTLGEKVNGTFIDVGGCRPVKTNNTYFFETERGWWGTIVEANPEKIPDLKERRKARVIQAAIWNVPNELVALTVPVDHYSLSTLFPEHKDEHYAKRNEGSTRNYSVETTTISKIMDEMGVHHVDYLSLDVEGAELAALEGMDQSRHSATCISVEHNLDIHLRVQIFELLNDNYLRLTDVQRLQFFQYGNEAHQRWFWNEDWYVHR